MIGRTLSYGRATVKTFALRELDQSLPRQPRLFDRVREALRSRHCSRRTEKSYVAWIRRFILFHGKRHPADLGAAEVSQFLSTLAIRDNVSASTQNQALSALLFRSTFRGSTTWCGPSEVNDFPLFLPAMRCAP